MVGTPRLYALRVEFESCRDLVEFLNHEIELKWSAVKAFHMAVSLRHMFLEVLKKIFPDDVHDLSESGLYGIVD